MIKSICDLCNKEAETKQVGLVKKIDVCPDCEGNVEKYAEELDELHDKIQKTWASGLAKLKKKYGESLPDLI